ncbi:uncharacterized protein BT62DRAFT_887106 [Guyanagaster necrorhizus]|uniref:Fruit-body specific protein a n=1 Tax=Guyanagaster necrorhizus TaxID=856835 RepID=A0A9P7W007_9AGAR|nr:uncharacterized protein BT62DRAFT_887106 [Guyanagaster necrorhizus MCA 3950]KAG7449444.1 hypothetical protein BT62DRAFT_887106 [Guyanagaster necrorhizus MCA 3950]
MHLSSILVTTTVALLVRGADNDTTADSTTVSLNATEIQILAGVTTNLTAEEYYGAAIPPWDDDCTPGWYYGDYPEYVANLTIPWLKDGIVCWFLDLFQSLSDYECPEPEGSAADDGYTEVFSNYTGAVEGSDYLTYGLVDTCFSVYLILDCKDMCDSVDGCVYINSYHDVNGKGGSPLLTCSLFSKCHSIADATNVGGQTQTDGSIDYITDSEGYCKE